MRVTLYGLVVVSSTAWNIAEAAAHPEITPAPVFEQQRELRARQVLPRAAGSGGNDTDSVFWVPAVVNETTEYFPTTCFSSQLIDIASSLWACCTPGGADCQGPTACDNGTLYYPGPSIAICTLAQTNIMTTGCGTYFLASSAGGDSIATHYYCAAQASAEATVLLAAPANAAASAGGSDQQPGATGTDSSSGGGSGKPANVGAIVGGVLGGVALLALIAFLVLLLLLRKKKQQQQAAAATSPSTAVDSPMAQGDAARYYHPDHYAQQGGAYGSSAYSNPAQPQLPYAIPPPIPPPAAYGEPPPVELGDTAIQEKSDDGPLRPQEVSGSSVPPRGEKTVFA